MILYRYTPLTNSITAIYVDQNIITRSLPLLATTRQIIGYNDEVIDTVLLSSSSPPIKTVSNNETAPNETTTTPKESHLAVATNSDLIRVYDLNRFSVSLLEGHKDVVLCLNRSVEGDILVSGSKDKTARIWRSTTLDQRSDGMEDWEYIGIAEGHVESVGAIAVSKKPKDLGASFIITASQDRTAKVWDLASILSPSTEEGAIKSIRLRSLTTSKIHDKDINALDISPNSQLLASASQDRTAKLFSIDYTPSSKNGTKPATANLKLLGTFKGHKRGVWSVKFSSVDMCVATGSGDRTIKIWNLSDFSCLKVAFQFFFISFSKQVLLTN
jgi:U3 small nucleolar RNA-associated protein 13